MNWKFPRDTYKKEATLFNYMGGITINNKENLRNDKLAVTDKLS